MQEWECEICNIVFAIQHYHHTPCCPGCGRRKDVVLKEVKDDRRRTKL